MNRHLPVPTNEENHLVIAADGGHENNKTTDTEESNMNMTMWAQLFLFLGVVVVLRFLSTRDDPAIDLGEQYHVNSGAQLLLFLGVVATIHRFGCSHDESANKNGYAVANHANVDSHHQMASWVPKVGLFVGVVLFLGFLGTSGSRTPIIDVNTELQTMSSNSQRFDDFGPGPTLLVDFSKGDHQGGDTSVINLGPHKASLIVEKSCKDPAFWVRLQGDALVGIKLQEEPNKQVWSGTFFVPMAGNYKLEAHWYGCGGKDPKKALHLYNFEAKGSSSSSSISSIVAANTNTTSLCPHSAWVSTKKLPPSDVVVEQPYIWFDPQVPTEKATLFKLKDTVISKEGTAGQEHGFYKFDQLSNYELLCWFGSHSAEQLYSSFLELRSKISRGQKPFKFRYFPTKNLVHPDRDWSDNEASRFRKCKHILVSLDEMEDDSQSLSQMEYQSQVETLLHHLQEAFPDETFPIWMLTVNEPPFQASSTTTSSNNCHSPTLPRTSDHPCNDALRDLFSKQGFQNRVQLLDNTDLTLAQLGENKQDTMAVIALRIFVFVGKRVQEWRAAGQSGFVGGLKRGEVVEPNGPLIRYEGWH
jgi:hypothetical protein